MRLRVLSGRTISKIRLGERGAGSAIDRLVELGAPGPAPGEPPPAWLDRLRRERHLAATRQPGLHTYCFELTRAARKSGKSLPRHPYPKLVPVLHPELPLLQR